MARVESIYLSYTRDDEEIPEMPNRSPFGDSAAVRPHLQQQQNSPSKQPTNYSALPPRARGKSLAGAARPTNIPPINSSAPVVRSHQHAPQPQQGCAPQPQPLQYQGQINMSQPFTRPAQTMNNPYLGQQQSLQRPAQAMQNPRSPQRPHLAVNVRAPSPVSPPRAAFAHSPTDTLSSPRTPHSQGMLSPSAPSPVLRKGNSPSSMSLNEEDDRFAMASNVGSNAHMDFWKRFSMVMHDSESEKPVEQKDKWLRQQLIKEHKWKIVIWSLALIIVIAVGGGLAYHFTHKNSSTGATEPSQHDFGLGGSTTSTNPLATLVVGAGRGTRRMKRAEDSQPTSLFTIPTIAPLAEKRMHRLKRGHGSHLAQLD